MLEFRAFTKRFGDKAAVEALSLQAAPGDVVALLGPNGSGKTTTIKAAAGLIRPTSGQALIGQPLRPAGEAAARRVCAFLPQRLAFPSALSGREVMTFYCRLRGAAEAEVDEALRMASLNGSSGRPVGTYSGGMVQRLGLAIALAGGARLLLLDEPTAALDQEGLCTFYGLIERRRDAGQTVLFSSHQMGDVERLADRFAVLVAGRLVATFTARELTALLADRGVMKVALARHVPGLVDRVRELAPRALVALDQIIVPGPAAGRPRVLDAIRAAGGDIVGLTAEEGRLDGLYRELVAGGHAS
jgi:Cu-processing system ATP-binding protein